MKSVSVKLFLIILFVWPVCILEAAVESAGSLETNNSICPLTTVESQEVLFNIAEFSSTTGGKAKGRISW